MFLSVAKQQTANLLNSLFPLEYILKRRRNRYILSYHRVVPAEQAHRFHMQRSMWVSVETFRKDMEWFGNHGELVDLDTILNSEEDHDRPLFSITFDDGWIDNYQHAYPVLKALNIPATIFLVTGAVETGDIFWVEDFLYKIATLDDHDTKHAIEVLVDAATQSGADSGAAPRDRSLLAEIVTENLKPLGENERKRILDEIYNRLNLDCKPLRNEILNWDQIREMLANGISFGSHTHNHVILQYADDMLIRNELEISRDIMKERLGSNPEYFCYPNARYRPDNAELLKTAGYRFAFRMHNIPLKSGYDDYFIPRYLLNEHLCSNRNMLMCKLLEIPGFR